MKICRACKQEKSLSEFYTNGKYKTRQKYKPRCKSCENKENQERFYKIISDFFGGLKCGRCGYDKSKWALDCHHTNDSEKDIEVSRLRTYSEDKIKAELVKCELVCSNCHREIHADSVSVPLP